MLDVLRARGFLVGVSDEERLRAALDRDPVTLYCGYDPTAPSLHVGSLVSLMALAHFQHAGHRPIVVLGGATGLIGDPSGKSTARPLLSVEKVHENAAALARQVGRLLDFDDGKALLVNNADWLMGVGYVQFLREVGRHFTLNQLMQHETYRERFEHDSLSVLELNYALVQAYDFLHLYRTRGDVLQIGGNDQWFNILAGVELIRRAEDAEAFALTTPLITTSSGQKMGKTESGAVWLDPDATDPFSYYQFWRNTEDADVGRFLRLFTFCDIEEIERLEGLPGAEINQAKERLACEATRLAHGQAAAENALATAHARFAGEGEDQGPMHLLTEPTKLVDVLAESGLADSRNQAKKLLAGGGVRLGNAKQTADRVVDTNELPALLRVGKRTVRLTGQG